MLVTRERLRALQPLRRPPVRPPRLEGVDGELLHARGGGLDDLKLRDLDAGHLKYTLIQMTWGFALRRNEDKDYIYSFAGTAESNESYPTFEAGCATMIENAIPAMLKKWTEDGGVARLAE